MDAQTEDCWDAGTSQQREALARLRGHVESEVGMVDAYRRLVESAPDEVVGYLAQLVYDDERRHHDLLADVLARLESHIRWERDSSSLPREHRTPVPPELAQELARLLAAEHADATALRRLRQNLRRLPGTALLALIVELMELDTTKHVRILEYLRASAAERRPGPPRSRRDEQGRAGMR